MHSLQVFPIIIQQTIFSLSAFALFQLFINFSFIIVVFFLQEAAQQGATEAPPADADVDLHFVAFVPGKDGHLWELDGRKVGPVDHGQTSTETLLRDVAAVVRRNFVEKANSLNFSLMALAAPQYD